MAYNSRRGTPGRGQDRGRNRSRRAMDNLRPTIWGETNGDEIEVNEMFDREDIHIQTLGELHNLRGSKRDNNGEKKEIDF